MLDKCGNCFLKRSFLLKPLSVVCSTFFHFVSVLFFVIRVTVEETDIRVSVIIYPGEGITYQREYKGGVK